MAALRELRRKNGLCFKYGAKWSNNHKCAAQVPLHVLEGILDALGPIDDSESEVPIEVEDEIIATVSQPNSLVSEIWARGTLTDHISGPSMEDDR